MPALPGGVGLRPRYTRKTMLLILAVTVAGLFLLLWGYRVLVAEGQRVADQIERQESPLWNPSLPAQ